MKTHTTSSVAIAETKFGRMRIESIGDFVTCLDFTTQDKDAHSRIASVCHSLERGNPHQITIKQLNAYFFGKLKKFSIKLKPCGTELQLKVWRELTRVPYGTTASYAQIAYRIGKPTAVRAVASAPIAIVVPCHRIIRSDGSMGEYAGGRAMKRRLLDLESQIR